MATTSLTAQQVEKVLGRCTGCFHCVPGIPSKPGSSSVCGLCLRNKGTTKDASARSDDGKIVYGLRDCFIAHDRFTMELRGETFLKGVEVDG
jgi:hypothetical protein